MKLRCTYSSEWKQNTNRVSPYYDKERFGYIIGESRNGVCYRVQWDGTRKSVDVLAKRFIRILSEGEIEYLLNSEQNPERSVATEDARGNEAGLEEEIERLRKMVEFLQQRGGVNEIVTE